MISLCGRYIVHLLLSHLYSVYLQITDLVHSLFLTHGLVLLPLFDRIAPTLNKMLVSGYSQYP